MRASFAKRIAAFALDWILIAGYLVVLAMVSSTLASGPLRDEWQALISSSVRMELLAFVTAILPVVLYYMILESSEGGATWGKRRMGLRVVNTSGERIGRRADG
ncbi:MAG: RDD family protein [Candidatus Eisenbacteria sp.]|nr:RDD family protein [Candidatus Eisenbacteria bacterium]